jgi:hypothetical protein
MNIEMWRDEPLAQRVTEPQRRKRLNGRETEERECVCVVTSAASSLERAKGTNRGERESGATDAKSRRVTRIVL